MRVVVSVVLVALLSFGAWFTARHRGATPTSRAPRLERADSSDPENADEPEPAEVADSYDDLLAGYQIVRTLGPETPAPGAKLAINLVDADSEAPIWKLQRAYLLPNPAGKPIRVRQGSGALRFEVPANETARIRVEASGYRSREIDVPPEPAGDVPPIYVPLEKDAHATGRVVLTVKTDDGTHIRSVRLRWHVVGQDRSFAPGIDRSRSSRACRFTLDLPPDRYRFDASACQELLADSGMVASVFLPDSIELPLRGGEGITAEIVLRRGGRVRVRLSGKSQEGKFHVQVEPLRDYVRRRVSSLTALGGECVFTVPSGQSSVSVLRWSPRTEQVFQSKVEVRIGEITEVHAVLR